MVHEKFSPLKRLHIKKKRYIFAQRKANKKVNLNKNNGREEKIQGILRH